MNKNISTFKFNSIGSEKFCHMETKRCIRQPVLTAEKNAKFLSNQTVQDQFIAEIAIQNENHREDIKLLTFQF